MFEELDLMQPGESFDGAMQMALDEVLLRRVTRPLLRIYQWDAPCITFGYFQKISDVRRLHPDLPAVRRWTGGGIVQHGKDMTFSLMVPKQVAAASLPPSLFYKMLHHLIAKKVAHITHAEIIIAVESHTLTGDSCFKAPVLDDLILHGGKILGGAMRRSGGALLYQGSLQLPERSVTPEMLASAMSRVVTSYPAGDDIKIHAETLTASRYALKSWNERR